jgi:argininosuccinate lyase
MRGMIEDLEPDANAMRSAAQRGYATATDLADWLVRELKLPFREAHHVTGAIVKQAESQGIGLEELPLEAMQAVEPRISKGVYAVLGEANSVRSRTSFGGTAPQNVRKMARAWIKRLEKGSGTG